MFSRLARRWKNTGRFFKQPSPPSPPPSLMPTSQPRVWFDDIPYRLFFIWAPNIRGREAAWVLTLPCKFTLFTVECQITGWRKAGKCDVNVCCYACSQVGFRWLDYLLGLECSRVIVIVSNLWGVLIELNWNWKMDSNWSDLIVKNFEHKVKHHCILITFTQGPVWDWLHGGLGHLSKPGQSLQQC